MPGMLSYWARYELKEALREILREEGSFDTQIAEIGGCIEDLKSSVGELEKAMERIEEKIDALHPTGGLRDQAGRDPSS